jgi:FecR protein
MLAMEFQMKVNARRLIVPVLALSWLPFITAAETIPGCTFEVRPDPPRQVYTCEGGLVIEAEAAARLTFIVPSSDSPPNAVRLDAGAVWIELDPAQVTPGQPGFQIRTPQAIASVRGTIYAVDVTENASAVFVAQGIVVVRERADGKIVQLDPGEGVDIAPGKAFASRRWGDKRVADLRGRFAR